MTIFRCIHVAANGIISFFFMTNTSLCILSLTSSFTIHLSTGIQAVCVSWEPITLNAEDILQITFSTNPGLWNPLQPPDQLEFTTGNGLITLPIVQGMAQFFDGNSLLGTILIDSTKVDLSTFTGGFGRSDRWKSPTSIATGPHSIVDFSTILDGTINGRVEITIVAGTWILNQDPNQGPSVSLFQSTSPTGSSSNPLWTNVSFSLIDNTPVSVPEPSSMLLLGAGLVGLAFTRKRISS